MSKEFEEARDAATKEYFQPGSLKIRGMIEDAFKAGADWAFARAEKEIAELKASIDEVIETRMKLYSFIEKLDKGEIVSSNVCSEYEIAAARACNRFYVDHKGFGYVLRDINSKEERDKLRARCECAIKFLDEALFQVDFTYHRNLVTKAREALKEDK